MVITSLSLQQFRSYNEATFELDKGINVVTGPNGSGKTNLLEAIYMLSMTRSFRGTPQSIVAHGADWFRIQADISEGHQAALGWQNGLKRITYDQQELKPHNYIGKLPVVLFEPGSLELIYGAPLKRRGFMDRILSLVDNTYFMSLLKLRRVLRQRNELLRRPRLEKDQIFGWDISLVKYADYVRSRREELIKELNQTTREAYQRVARNKDEIRLEYSSSTNGDYAEILLKQLADNLEKDHRYGNTSVGPHRDDLRLFYNDIPLEDAGSRGEVRTAVLALVMAEFEYLSAHAQTQPIVLLDDVFSELDKQRQTALLENVSRAQTIVTTTEKPGKTLHGHEIIVP